MTTADKKRQTGSVGNLTLTHTHEQIYPSYIQTTIGYILMYFYWFLWYVVFSKR